GLSGRRGDAGGRTAFAFPTCDVGNFVAGILPVRVDQVVPPLRLHVAERDAVLRALWTGKARFDAAQVQAKDLGVIDRGRGFIRAEQALLLVIPLDQINLVVGAAGEAEVIERL